MLAQRTAATSLQALGFEGLTQLCRAETAAHAPDPTSALDPRTDLPVAYSPARAGRAASGHCVVCDSETCPAVDVADWPGTRADDDGHADAAWLTPNLFPNVYPFTPEEQAGAEQGMRGIHLVQWTSRHHGRRFSDAARLIVGQLAAAEEFLLHNAPAIYPDTGDGHRGHVGIIKNRGSQVGGSVEHDHQQILLTNAEPAEPRRVRGLGAALLRDAPAELTVDTVDGLATTIVPPFMSRPLQAFVVPATATRPPDSGHLHHLAPDVLDAFAVAIGRLAAAADTCMSHRDGGGEPAWNLIVHTGHQCGPLVELRPFTQPLGGYEHLGLYVCEELPSTSAARLREALPQS